MALESNSPKARWSLLVLAAIIAAGIAWRARPLASRGLEYDELFTLQFYALAPEARIFSELATPNNHPLHSLLVRWSVEALGPSFLAVRMPVALAGIALLLVVAWLAGMLLRERAWVVGAVALVAFNGGLIHFSQTARGYELQVLLLTLQATLVVLACREPERWGRWLALPLAVVPVLAVLTLPTSVLYLLPLGTASLVWIWRSADTANWRTLAQRHRWLLIAWAVAGAGCLAWLWHGLPQFQQGRQAFGTPLTSLADWWVFVWPALLKTGSLPLLGLTLIALAGPRRWLALGILGYALLPLLAMPLTRGGPPRVYLPMVPLLAIGAMAGLLQVVAWLPRTQPRLAWGAAAVAILFGALTVRADLARWTPTDWFALCPQLERAYPLDHYLIYPAIDAYVVSQLHRDLAVPNHAARAAYGPRYLVSLASAGRLSVFESGTHGAVSLEVPPTLVPRVDRVAGLTIEVFALEPVTTPQATPAALYLAILGPLPKTDIQRALSAPADSPWRPLRDAFWGDVPATRWYGLNDTFVARPDDPQTLRLLVSADPPLDEAAMCRLQANLPAGTVRFYRLKSGE